MKKERSELKKESLMMILGWVVEFGQLGVKQGRRWLAARTPCHDHDVTKYKSQVSNCPDDNHQIAAVTNE